jgi:hypothetical protein
MRENLIEIFGIFGMICAFLYLGYFIVWVYSSIENKLKLKKSSIDKLHEDIWNLGENYRNLRDLTYEMNNKMERNHAFLTQIDFNNSLIEIRQLKEELENKLLEFKK